MKVFFLGETYRADAQTWIKGMREYGPFEVETWELPRRTGPFARYRRGLDWLTAFLFLPRRIKRSGADMVAAYRLTSYGFLGAISTSKPLVLAQQGRFADIYPPDSATAPLKKMLVRYSIRRAGLIHCWGSAMVPALLELKPDLRKLVVLAKGVDIEKFKYIPEAKPKDKITAVVTRSLAPDYRHEVILKAIQLLVKRGVPIEVYMIGDGVLRDNLHKQSKELGLDGYVHWMGLVPNPQLPEYLIKSNIYISMPVTEGVSSSLFEAMACGCYPVVTDLPGNQSWIRNGENGRLIPVDDFTQLADALEQLYGRLDTLKAVWDENHATVMRMAVYQKNMPYFASLYRQLVETGSFPPQDHTGLY